MPSEIGLSEGNTFVFDICGKPWQFDSYPTRYTEVLPSCFQMQTKRRGNAYFRTGNECAYSFHDAVFDSTDTTVQIKYTSIQQCKADPTKNFKFIIEGECSDTESDLTFVGKNNETIVDKTCEAKLKYTGQSACPLLTNPIYDLTKKVPE